ncbi:type II toxin-antitoxin system VapC family toxin [Massilia sp. MB5]|uniref:type II toxin-antitoxin system VapC family toxin n=1 Tax=Massilia sp. MB5 TaxID=2919578 RepID=UPI001F0EA336|nr:type II toxin-antitoxin system VapC family toxin [Massilia sp. MB5]UMR30236.1 type II toxin-antitoxin system VapC family toxin [Massilia sp. MB5]
MRVLLDTHIYLWWLAGDRKLTSAARDLIVEAAEVYVSSATIWEIAIKSALGKLTADVGLLVDEIAQNDFLELSISARHAAAVHTLPLLHADPFDRLLVAQAITEPLPFLTHDSRLAAYSELVKVM